MTTNTKKPSKTIGERIYDCRYALDMTQGDLAAVIGSHTGTISLWETDRIVPTLAKIEALAKALGVHPAYLAGWQKTK